MDGVNFCVWCGFKLDEEDNYCSNCGKKIENLKDYAIPPEFNRYVERINVLKERFDIEQKKARDIGKKYFGASKDDYDVFLNDLDNSSRRFYKDMDLAFNIPNRTDRTLSPHTAFLKESMYLNMQLISLENLVEEIDRDLTEEELKNFYITNILKIWPFNMTFKDDSYFCRTQIPILKEEFDKREKKLSQIIEKRFLPSSITYSKFMAIVNDAHEKFYYHADSVLNILKACVHFNYKIEDKVYKKFKILESIINKMDQLYIELRFDTLKKATEDNYNNL